VSKTEDVLRTPGDKLIGYFPAGFPTLPESVDAALAMCEAGIDVLEFGVPYSDPVMDGLVIQQATELALENGFKLNQLFGAVQEITSKTSTPVLVMTYWNPVLQYGVERFARELVASGAAGLITPDLIPDEAGEWLKISDELGLDRVFLVAPSSTESRAATATELSRGFVYAVSTMGITGVREDLDELARGVVGKVRKADPDKFVAVGIGVSTGEQAREVNDYADGAIVGSVFVRAFQSGGIAALANKVRELVAGLNK
jgi:tryptophan synthase alpha chain